MSKGERIHEKNINWTDKLEKLENNRTLSATLTNQTLRFFDLHTICYFGDGSVMIQ